MPTAGLVAAVWLAIGAAHVAAFSVVAGWRAEGDAAALRLFELSPLALLVLWSGVTALPRGASGARLPPAGATAIYAALLLVPSSAVAAAGLVAYGIWTGLRSAPPARAAALCVAGLGACALWQAVGQRLLATPLLSVDAEAARWLLSWLQPGLVRSGNVLLAPDGHRLVVLLACATTTGLPIAMLASAALAVRNLAAPTWRWVWPTLALAPCYAALNALRLAAMASSAGAYGIVHGPLGANLFDALSVLLVLGAARLGRPAAHLPAPAIAPPRAPCLGGPRWAYLGVTLVLLAGLGMKGFRYAAAEPSTSATATQAVADMLAAHGWRIAGTAALISGTDYAATTFANPACGGRIAVAVVRGNGESMSATVTALGGEVAFLDGGDLGRTPPRSLFWQALSRTALAHLGLGGGAAPLVVIAPPPPQAARDCAPPPAPEWRALGAALS